LVTIRKLFQISQIWGARVVTGNECQRHQWLGHRGFGLGFGFGLGLGLGLGLGSVRLGTPRYQSIAKEIWTYVWDLRQTDSRHEFSWFLLIIYTINHQLFVFIIFGPYYSQLSDILLQILLSLKWLISILFACIWS
jgi:hypothetical protein